MKIPDYLSGGKKMKVPDYTLSALESIREKILNTLASRFYCIIIWTSVGIVIGYNL